MFKKILNTENDDENVKAFYTKYYKKIFPFYQSFGRNFELKKHDVKLSCRVFYNSAEKGKIIIVNGYNESYLKYAEIIHDLYQKQYSVYAYDHRGQGFSQKFKNQKNRGFIDKFENFINDLEFIFKFVQNDGQNLPIYLLAHSMGGLISSFAMCQNKIAPQRVVLSAPLFGINLGYLSFLEYPAYLLSTGLTKIGFGKSYAFGQKDCFPLVSFKKNEVTHSVARYQVWQTHIRETPEVQLGGPTFQWVSENVRACHAARLLGEENKVPVLLLQAEQDTIVQNDAQDVFLQHCKNSQKKIIHRSKHEILMEIDPLRSEAMNDIYAFFE